MIAVGTTKGAVLIYRMTKRDAVPTLIRSMNVLPTKLKKPVLDMSFGYDSTSQLVTLNEGTTRDSRIVRLWSISVQPDLKDPTIHSRDAFGSFAPTLPAVSLQIDGEDGVKVGYVDRRMKKEMLDAWNEEESNSGIFGGKSKKIKEKEQREMKVRRRSGTKQQLVRCLTDPIFASLAIPFAADLCPRVPPFLLRAQLCRFAR